MWDWDKYLGGLEIPILKLDFRHAEKLRERIGNDIKTSEIIMTSKSE